MGGPDVVSLITSTLMAVVGAMILVVSRPGSAYGRARGNTTPQMRFLGAGLLLTGVSQLGSALAPHGWIAPVWTTLGVVALVLFGFSLYYTFRKR